MTMTTRTTTTAISLTGQTNNNKDNVNNINTKRLVAQFGPLQVPLPPTVPPSSGTPHQVSIKCRLRCQKATGLGESFAGSLAAPLKFMKALSAKGHECCRLGLSRKI